MSNIAASLRGLFSNESIDGAISSRAKFFLAFPAMPVTIGNVLIHNAYIKYYSDVIGLDIGFVGVIYMIFGIWNAINDPMLGVIIDRFRYTEERGKYVYFMRVTAPLIVLSAFAMLFAQPAWNEWVIFGVFLVLLFIFDTAQTAYSIAYTSYVLVAAPSKDERVDVSVIGAYVGNVGGFLATIIPTLLLVGDNDKSITVLLFSGVLIINAVLYWIAVRSIHDQAEMYKNDVQSSEGKLVGYLRENAKEAFTSRAFVSFILYQVVGRGPYSFYFTPFLYLMDHVFRFSGGQATIIDVSSGIVMLILVPFLGRWIKRVGTKTAIIVGSLPTAIGFLSLYFVQGFWQVMLAYWVIILGSEFSNLSQRPMMGAIIDQDEQKTGVRKAGLFVGLNALLTIPVSGIQAAIFTTLISRYGFASGGVAQSARALAGIRIGAGIIPFGFVLLGTLPILLSPINRTRERELSDFAEQRHRVVVQDQSLAMEG
jgi:glycoside/pentoside/hexuronide:cation symporter, GPH family